MEKFKLISLIFLLNIIYVKSYSDNVTCCPPNYFVFYRNLTCFDPRNNDTKQLRINCESAAMFQKFNINNKNQMEYKVNYLFTEVFEPDVYCIGNRTSIKNTSSWKTVAVLCVEEEEPDVMDGDILGYCMIVSVVFLTLTVVVYSSLPELRDLQGKSFISFCFSLGMGLAILSILKLYRQYTDMNLCAARGFSSYFFVISAFFWMTGISVQVLVSTKKPISVVDKGWKEFSKYAIFAWGSAAILTIILIIVNYHPGPHKRPNIGLIHCWFYTREQQWIYMYGVMSLLIAVNICIFIYTASLVWRYSFSSTHVKAVRYKLVMTIRLIILMGLPWVFEMISSLAKKHIVWAILDIFNTLQGLLIFLLLVVFRKRVIKAMYKHGWLNCISGPVERFLAVGDDAEETVIQHTVVPLNDRPS